MVLPQIHPACSEPQEMQFASERQSTRTDLGKASFRRVTSQKKKKGHI